MSINIMEVIIKDRQERCMNQMEYAKLFGVTQQTIDYWEKGRRKPNPQMIALTKLPTRDIKKLMLK